MTNTQLKTQIDTDITNKTTSKSISPLNVGKNIKDVVDYAVQETSTKELLINKSTSVTVDATSDTKYPSVKAVKDYVDANSGGLPYKVYTALLSCTDSVTPVLITLENTIGSIVWTRNSAGNYSATLTDAFTIEKTIGFTSINNGYVASASFSIGANNDVVFVQTFSTTTGNPIDYIEKLAIEIRVYN